MTESIAVVLLLSLPLALRGALGISSSTDQSPQSAQIASKLISIARATSINKFALVAGIISGLLVLLKPGMIPSVVLSCIACLIISRMRIALVLSLTLGLVLALSPWMLYTKQTTGKAAITVQRMPVHNALIGWDPETRGWQTNPPSGFEHVLNTGGEPLSTIEGIWISHPENCVQILLDKFGHLYSTPWNDYRTRSLGLDVRMQAIYHYGLLFAGLFGLFAWIATEERKNRLAMLCVAAAAGQCVYLMFEPVCRYAFPQFAFAPVLFSIALLKLISRPIPAKALSIAAALSVVCVASVAFSEASANKYLNETTHIIKPGEQLQCTISFDANNAKQAETALLLVDGTKDLEDAQIEINGQKTPFSFLPFNYYDAQRYEAFNLVKELGYGLNVSVDDFRIWRAIPIPIDQVKTGKLGITLTANKNLCTIYGDSIPSRNYLSPDFLCVNRLINSKTSMEMRNESAVPSGKCIRAARIKSSDGVKELTVYPRIKLLLAIPAEQSKSVVSSGAIAGNADVNNSNTSSADVNNSNTSSGKNATSGNASSTDAPSETELKKNLFSQKLTASDFDENLSSTKDCIKISKSILKAARTTATVIKIPQFAQASNLSISLTGQLRASGKPGSVGIVVETITDQKKSCFLARLPSSLRTTKDWSKFEIRDLAPYRTPNGYVTSISVALFPGPFQQVAGYGCDKTCTDTELRNMELKVHSVNLPSLEHQRLLYY